MRDKLWFLAWALLLGCVIILLGTVWNGPVLWEFGTE